MWKKSSKCESVMCVEVEFVKSSKSGGHECVEVGKAHGLVYVRDSKDPNGHVLVFTPQEWDAFVEGAKDGEFDA